MGWRFLVDEDTDNDTAIELADLGHDAVTVEGGPGRALWIVERLTSLAKNRVLASTDRHFLDPDLHAGIRVPIVTDGDADGHEIAEVVDELARLAERPSDLKSVTWISPASGRYTGVYLPTTEPSDPKACYRRLAWVACDTDSN